MFPRFRLRLILVLCFALPLLAQQAAQDSGNAVPKIKTQVRRVLVDVIVTDAKGDAITGLKKKDFEVREDGTPQAIATFEEHRGAEPTEIKLPPMPPNVFTNFPTTQVPDSVNVLLLDALNTPSNDQVYVRTEMIKYLKSVPAGTRMAVFTLASRLRMLQGFTADSSELLSALNRGGAEPHPSALLQSNVEKDADQRRIDFMNENAAGPPTPQPTSGVPPVPGLDPISAAQQFLADTAVQLSNARIEITLDALQQLARYLAGFPGRKNVIWFSGSFPAGIVPNADLPDPFVGLKDYEYDFRKATDLLTAADAALYPVAAEGLVADSTFPTASTEIGEKRISVAAQDSNQRMRTGVMDRDSNHATMESLAKDTGGKAFYNTNGLNDALAHVVSNGSRYYTLAYSPSNTTMDGKFRRIQVKLDSKATLAYRRGYYADDLASTLTAEQKPEVDPLLRLMGRNLPDYTQILYKVRVQPVDPQPAPGAPRAGSNPDLKGPVVRYAADFAITAQDVRFEQSPDGARHGNVEIAIAAYDRDGKPLNFVLGKGDVMVRPDVYARMLKVGMQVHKEIDVPKGFVYLRTGIYDFKAGTAGTLGMVLNAASSK